MKQEPKETSAALDCGARQVRGGGARGTPEQTTDEHLKTHVAAAGARTGRAGGAALRDDPGHDQSLGASPRADDGLSAPDGREGSGDLRPSADERASSRSGFYA